VRSPSGGAAASRFSVESWLFVPPMTAPACRYCIASGHFSTIHASGPFPALRAVADRPPLILADRPPLILADRSPPKGGLPPIDKPMTLSSP
jgi:hypothetical protein